jgi:nicotinamide riboside transporter PnuC
MVKRKVGKKASKSSKSKEVCCDWSPKEWVGFLVSELSLYLAIVYTLFAFDADVSFWFGGIVLLVLVNLTFFTCPYMRKHFM